MGVLQIFSQQPGSGKTSLAAALLIKLAQSQTPAAYCRPFSSTNDPARQNSETQFIQQTILIPSGGPAVPPSNPLPAAGASSGLPQAEGQHIRSTVESLKQSAAAVIVDGPDLAEGTGLSPAAAAQATTMAGAKALVLFRYSQDLSVAEIRQTVEPFGSDLGGIALTLVTKHRIDEVQNGLLSELRSVGIPVTGLIPESRILQGPTVREIAETLGARWIQEPANIDAPVERFLIGGNIMDSGPEYYGRYDNQAVIVRSQRPDIQLASLLAGTRCLVLTGGGEPTEYIKAEAMQRDVPLMSVSSNTSDTADALEPLAGLAHPLNLAKIERFAGELDRHLDVESLLALLA